MKHTTLERRVLTATLGLSVVSIAAVAITVMLMAEKIVTEQTVAHLESEASLQASRIETAIVRREQTVQLVASRTQMRISLAAYLDDGASAERDRVRKILNDALASVRGLEAIHIADAEGKVLVSTDSEREGADLGGSYPLNQDGEVKVDDLFRDSTGGVHTLLSMPLELEGRRLAMLYIETSTTDLDRILSDYTGLSKTGEAVLARRTADGGAEFITPLRFDATAALSRRLSPEQTDVPVLRALNGEIGHTTDAINYRGHPALAAMRQVPSTGWGLAVIIDEAEAFAPLKQLRLGILVVAVIAALLAVWAARWVSSALTQNFSRLVAKANRLASGSHDVASVLDERGAHLKEVVELESAYDEMTRRWIKQAEELEAAYVELASTQDDLLRKEKMAYLGEMVSTISHEVNTPLGISLTVADMIGADLKKVKNAIAANKIAPSEIEDFLNRTEESIKLVESNYHRAATMMRSFRNVAVDQASNRERLVVLREYVAEVLMTLRPKLMRTRMEVENKIPAHLTVTTLPGVVTQVLTNLLVNASIHAFDPGSKGRVEITADQDDDRIVMTIADNGKGMDENVREKAFDEFFTTRPDSGGSGIGLHLSRKLAVETLGGDLSVESTPGAGTTFTLVIANRKAAN